jgi:hypothetical protein
MLVVAAGPRDSAARAFAEYCGRGRARLLAPADLSRPGWRFDPLAPEDGVAVIGGLPVPVRAIRTVLTRLPAVSPLALPQIVDEDREYVAGEMTAFLLAWLDALSCRVVNRPGPPCLAGPGWGPTRWSQAAAEAGWPLPHPAHVDEARTARGQKVTVLGGRCLSMADGAIERGAVRLAALANVALLEIQLSDTARGPTFVTANPWPDPSSTELAGALRAYLTGGAPC